MSQPARSATHPAPMPGWVAALLALTVALIATVLLGVGSASAHAYVETYVPDDGAVLAAAPEEIRVTFDADVEAPIAAIRVYDGDSQRVDTDAAHLAPGDPRTVVGYVPGDLADGTYVVTWRARSFDGHTIIGTFQFSIGQAGAAADAAAVADETPAVLAGLGWLARVATAVGTIVSAGAGLLFLMALRRRPRSWRRDQEGVRRLVRRASVVAFSATVVALVILPFEQAGTSGFASAPGRAALDALVSPFGAAAVARLIALLPLALGLRTSSGELLLTLWAFALASLAIDGHAATEAPVWLLLTSDMVHLVAAAAWVGGMAAAVIVVRERRRVEDHVGAADVVGRFSATATIALGAVGVSGAMMAISMVRTPAAAVSTDYGRAMLVKLALVAIVVLVGAVNHWHLVPRIKAGTDARRGLQRLGRSMRVEGALLLAVLGVTGVLVQLPTAVDEAGVDQGASQEVLDAVTSLEGELVVEDGPSGPPLVHLLALGIAGAVAGAHVLRRGSAQDERDVESVQDHGGDDEEVPDLVVPEDFRVGVGALAGDDHHTDRVEHAASK